MATYRELKSQAETLLAQAEELRKKELTAAIADIKAKMQEFGISVEMLRGESKKPGAPAGKGKGKRAAVPVKYRDNLGNQWTGRGIKPKWLQKALAEGAKLEQFAI